MANRKGWARGGSVEAVKASVLFLLVLVLDAWILLFRVLQGNMPAIEVAVALLAVNIVVIGLSGHYIILSRIRMGLWSKVYPLSENTVLDSVEGYFDGKGVSLKDLGESHTYTESYSNILKSAKPRFEVRLRSVSFPEEGVAVLVGPEDRKNKAVLAKFMDEFDDVVENDLEEGIRRVSPKNEEEE
jgi:hypothetical protein